MVYSRSPAKNVRRCWRGGWVLLKAKTWRFSAQTATGCVLWPCYTPWRPACSFKTRIRHRDEWLMAAARTNSDRRRTSRCGSTTTKTDGFDEMFDHNGEPRPEAKLLLDTTSGPLGRGQLQRCQQAAEHILVQLGITFNVYGDSAGTERRFPSTSCRGSSERKSGTGSARFEAADSRAQRVHQRHLSRPADSRDKIIPGEVIARCGDFRPQCVGINPPNGVWVHITGTVWCAVLTGRSCARVVNPVPSGPVHAREPRPDEAPRSRCSRDCRCPRGGVPACCSRRWSRWPRRRQHEAGRGGVDARHLTRRYFEHSYLAQKMGIPAG